MHACEYRFAKRTVKEKKGSVRDVVCIQVLVSKPLFQSSVCSGRESQYVTPVGNLPSSFLFVIHTSESLLLSITAFFEREWTSPPRHTKTRQDWRTGNWGVPNAAVNVNHGFYAGAGGPLSTDGR